VRPITLHMSPPEIAVVAAVVVVLFMLFVILKTC
jgi:hypothetical protein